MKAKHLKIRIAQCVELAKASNCPRRKFGAMLVDPSRNVVLMDGYNGGPRGGGRLCGGSFCEREGLTRNEVEIKRVSDAAPVGRGQNTFEAVVIAGETVQQFNTHADAWVPASETAHALAQQKKDALLAEFPGVPSGTHMELGCHHAEMNVICNAADSGVATRGAWLIVTGEPCMMCAKMIHHAGISRVITVRNGYLGKNGVKYLQKHSIPVSYVEGPEDPRIKSL